jgi:putative phage-type endonuclease
MSLPKLPDNLPANYVVHPRVLELINTEQFVQRTPEWYERRKTLMTASNAAGAIGIKPFESFRGDAREDCLRNLVSGSFKGNIATQHGCDHEDMVRDRFCAISGETCLDFGLLVHPTKPWLAASPDGITLNGLMIEIKCPYKRRIVPGEVPHHYFPQVQTQMEVCQLDRCAFVQWMPAHLHPDGIEIFDIVVVERDRAWFAKHEATLYSFWEDLMKRRETYVKPPPPTTRIRATLYDDLVSVESTARPAAVPATAEPATAESAATAESNAAAEPTPAEIAVPPAESAEPARGNGGDVDALAAPENQRRDAREDQDEHEHAPEAHPRED